MRFMQTYKRLDALCRDMNGIGVTGYIEDMEKAANGSRHVSGWKADYQRLKYYRHIRNQIAHEVDATEEELCSPEDAVWIEEFYQRILIHWQYIIIWLLGHKETQEFQRKKLTKLWHIRPIPSHHHVLQRTQYRAILW